MKKTISILSVMAILMSGYAYAQQDEELMSVCNEAAERDGVSSEAIKEYVDNCIKDILADEEKEKMESK